jgi:hypothetical protein
MSGTCAEPLAYAKAVATLKARAALAGFTLTQLVTEGGFVIARWDQARELATIADVERFLQALGA